LTDPRAKPRTNDAVPSAGARGVLSAVDVTFGFPRRSDFLGPIRLDLRAGQCWGIIGPNGAGKSTLLRLLVGLLTPRSGDIRLEGRAVGDVPLRQRAQRIAYLPQHLPGDLAMTAREIVLMGRFPHRRFGLFESADDARVAGQAMATTGTLAFADRPISSLSGGEAQRVHVAAAIAQQPAVLLLDEPTAALDLYHQLSIFAILRRLVERDSLAVAVVTHDINLAGRFCSQVLLLDDGKPVAAGPPEMVLRAEILEPVYRVKLAALTTEHARGAWMVPLTPHGDGEPGDAPPAPEGRA